MKKGDLIEIIAPGSAAPFENLEKGAEKLRSWGYKVQFDSEILKPNMYLAQNDQYRWKHLKKALLDPKVKAIWCLRGGYGSIRLLPELAKLKKPKNKKLLIGFSDVTSLHIFLSQKWNWPVLHASLIDRLAQNTILPEDSNLLESALSEQMVKNSIQLQPLNKAATQKKMIKGSLVGGNLVVATSTLGTPYQIKGDGQILFFEEISERGYRIDRCLQQLEQAGVFKKVKAVVLGDFVKGEESDGKDLVTPTLLQFFENKKFPVFKGLPMGHGARQHPIFFGTDTIISCGQNSTMINFGPE